MKKYLLISIFSFIPFTLAFADATVDAKFEGTGQITLKSTSDETKKTDITQNGNTPIVPGQYNILIEHNKTMCAEITKVDLEDNKIYKISSTKDSCGVEDDKGKKLTSK